MFGNALAYASAACLVMALGGCSVFNGMIAEPPAHESQPATESSGRRDGEGRIVSSSEQKGRYKSGPAVVALMAQAGEYEAAEEFPKAGAALERALRIEPRNPEVYSRLAAVLLAQNLPDEAESLARKSNSLAKHWPALEARNWMTIAGAMRLRGDSASADAAEQRARQLDKASGE